MKNKINLFILIMVSTISIASATEYSYDLPSIEIKAPFVRQSQTEDKLKLTDKITRQEREVQIQETTPGFRQPILRGLQGDKIYLSVDQNDFTNAMFRSGPNQYYSYIPSEFVKDISLGKGIEDLNNNSFGGSIDRTLGINTPKYLKGSNLEQNATIVSVENFINGGKTVITYKKDDLSFGALFQTKSSTVVPDGEVPHSNYNQKGFYIEKNKYKLIFTRSDDVDRTDKFLKNDPRIYEVQQYIGVFKDFHVNYDYTIKTSYQNFYEDINNPTELSEDKKTKSNTNVYQVQNEYYLTDNIILTNKNKIEDIYYSKDYNIPGNSAKKYNIYNSNIGLTYFHSEGDFEYSTNAVFDYTYNSASSGKDFTALVFGAKAKYKNVYTSVSQGFKYPTIFDLEEAVDDSIYEIPNNNLKQEKSIKLEGGYNLKEKYFSFNGTVFYNFLEDMIIREKTTEVVPGSSPTEYKYQLRNADTGYTYGANINTVFMYNDIVLDIFAEYVYGKTDLDYISKLTPFRTDTRLEYKNFGLVHRYAISSNTLSEADKGDIRIKDHNYGYNQFDIEYTYNYAYSKTKHEVKFSIKNITNNTGRVLGSGTDFEKRYLYIKYSIAL